MRRLRTGAFVAGLTALSFAGCGSQAEKPRAPRVEMSLAADVTQVKPGDRFTLGLRLQIEKGWHIYWKHPGDAGFPTTVRWRIPEKIKASDLLYPTPRRFDEPGGLTVLGYKDDVLFLAPVIVSSHWEKGEPIPIEARLEYLVCETLCVPGQAVKKITIPSGPVTITNPGTKPTIEKALNEIPTEQEETRILATYKSEPQNELAGIKPDDFLKTINAGGATKALSLGVALFLALLGGLILNLMPCVLPVLSIKIIRLLKQTESSPRHVRNESLLFVTGILTSFLFLAGIVVGLKTAGQNVGWGFQFQEPRFLIVLSALVFAFSLSLFGVYDFTTALPARLNDWTRRRGWLGPFSEGILATTLATPCSAPLLGPALGFAFSQPPALIFLFFLIIGVGLSAPYLLLAIVPSSLRLLPKPGAWMDVLKNVLGLPLAGTALWLLWVLFRQDGTHALWAAAGLLGAVTAGLFILKIGAAPSKTTAVRWVARLGAAGLIIGTYLLLVEPVLRKMNRTSEPHSSAQSSEAIDWVPFSVDKLKSYLDQKKTVFVDFSADWCLTCKVNEKTALSSPRAAALLKEKQIVAMKADWTRRDEEIGAVLKQLNRSGVPVYVIFKNGDATNPTFLPEILTEQILLHALEQIN